MDSITVEADDSGRSHTLIEAIDNLVREIRHRERVVTVTGSFDGVDGLMRTLHVKPSMVMSALMCEPWRNNNVEWWSYLELRFQTGALIMLYMIESAAKQALVDLGMGGT